MVEGHSVHRVAAGHRARLVGKTFAATSPNGRFVEGAEAIDGKVFRSVEAVGKNLFAFFGEKEVVHVHFGMAGNWAVFDTSQEAAPPSTPTTRLRLTSGVLVALLSAMTVVHGDTALYTTKRLSLGQDPLRLDADPDLLWTKVSKSKKSIGNLVMDQSYFCGPGNIYRAEILFKARIHPDVPGLALSRAEFDRIWLHTVALLKRGFETGSILTVDNEKDNLPSELRRYIYNAAKCPMCSTSIKSWQIAGRTAYACPSCQPPPHKRVADDATVFRSHCVRESPAKLARQKLLTVAELKEQLKSRGAKTNGLKPELQARLDLLLEEAGMTSALEAATDKILAGESRAVEHVADIAPSQVKALKIAATSQVKAQARKIAATPPLPKRRRR